MHCGLCLEKCPTYRVTGNETKSPRGRLFLMRANEEGRLSPSDTKIHLDDCLLCRACETACPSGVEYGSLLSQSREGQANLFLRGFLSVAFSSRIIVRLLALCLRLLRGLHIATVLEKFSPQPLRGMLSAIPTRPTSFHPKPGQQWPAKGAVRGKVGIHLGCTQPGLFGSTLKDTIALLQEQGFDVVAPPQPVCCGAIHAHSGMGEKARHLAELTLAAFPEPLDAILIPAAGCAAHIKENLSDSSNIEEPLLFLHQRGLRGTPEPLPIRVAWDPPCHLQHVLGSTDEVPSLLASIPKLNLLPLKESGLCCGAGGINFIRSPKISDEVTRRKMEHIQAAEADIILSSNPGCQMRLDSGSRDSKNPLPVKHPISLLAESYCESRR